MNRLGSSIRLRKIVITCENCQVSESFYSSMSVERFRREHVGHDMVEGETDVPTAGPKREPPNGRQDAENSEKVRLLKVLVELVMLPTYPSPVFTITGVKEDLKSAFVQVVSPSQRDQVNETLEKGKFLDSGSADTVYVWERKAVTFSEDATLAMSLARSPNPALPGPAEVDSLRSQGSPASSDGEEFRVAASGRGRLGLATKEVAPRAEAPAVQAPPSPHVSAEPPHPPASRNPPKTSRRAAARSSPEPVALVEPSPRSSGVATPAAASSGGLKQPKAEEGNYLLVSRSWYIEGGSKNMREAVRISKLLRPFRWTVQPAYTIGVMIDDILSVETANGEIGGDMTKQIEGAGYKLSRVSVEKGKPVAWFKKEPASGETPRDTKI
ncbi:MAG: hypothetical protein OK442_07435 [Thaumarchaeota archaeon]|nr:hypothetical protein [Nitrososphaerota archaeon]